jgi:hypothetical protein
MARATPAHSWAYHQRVTQQRLFSSASGSVCGPYVGRLAQIEAQQLLKRRGSGGIDRVGRGADTYAVISKSSAK